MPPIVTSLAVGDMHPIDTNDDSITSHLDDDDDDAESFDDDGEDGTTTPSSFAASGIVVDDGIVRDYNNGANDHVGQHPALQTMCVMDCHSRTRIVPNGPPTVLSNDCFEGHVMLLVRTPDVDSESNMMDAETALLGEVPARVSEYFRGKKRRFEFQFQIRLKKVPDGPLFLGCELEHPIKVGTLTKGLVNILLAMVRRINPGFHYSWGVTDASNKHQKHLMEQNEYEKTHLSFPVEASMDRIVITKPGETPPTLGYELMETNESVKRRRKTGAGSVDWNLHDTYTMCLWSAYVDWIKWRSINVPGVAPFSLSRVTGSQPIYLSVYEMTSCHAHEYKKKRPHHYIKDLNVYTRLEFSNQYATTGGVVEEVLGVLVRKRKNSQGTVATDAAANTTTNHHHSNNNVGGTSTSHGLTAGLLPGLRYGGVSHSSHSMGDTESIDSDLLETLSRITT